jgi:O-antigen/teichoic acid export membrane protein
MAIARRRLLFLGALRGAPAIFIGAICAQAIAFLASPVLTRVYAPEQMGTFALYTSAIAVLALASTARYDFAIISPNRDAVARALVVVVNVVALFMFVASMVVLACGLLIRYWLGDAHQHLWMLAIPLGVFCTAIQLGYSAYLMRHVQTGAIAAVRIATAACSSLLAIIFGYLGFGTWGLLSSSLIALATAALLAWTMSGLPIMVTIPVRRVLGAAKRYRDYPKVDLPSTLFGVVGGQLPTLLLGGLFGASFLGFYALVDRVLAAPSNIIGSAVGSVYRVKATQSNATSGGFRKEFARTALQLVPIAVLFFLPMIFFGEVIFTYVFGAKWRVAGHIAQTLSPLYFIRFIASPLSMSLYVRNKMRFDLKGQMLLLSTVAISMLIGWRFNDQWLALKLMAFLNGVLYFFYIVYAYQLSGVRGREA